MSTPIDRRTFVRRAGATGMGLSLSGLLAACGSIKGVGQASSGGSKTVAAITNHPKTAITALHISNWPLYIDKKTNKEFVAKYNVKDFSYKEDVNDNEEFFGKVQQQLARGQDIGRDIMILTDWMAARNVRLGYLEPLDKRNIPNAANLQPALQIPPWDPNRAYSLPWQSGMTAIGYNRKTVGREVKSSDELFDPKWKGKVSLLNDAREVSNLFMLRAGKEPATASIDDVLAAIDECDKVNRSGQIRRFTGNDYTQDLTKGNLVLCQAWSGDIIQLQADNPDLLFAIPEEGANLWSDNMLIPKHAQHPYAAETYMNFVYDPEIAAQIAAYVNYVTPVVGAQEILAKKDPKLAENQLIFPDKETLAKLHPFPNLNEDEERRMNEAWQRVVGG